MSLPATPLAPPSAPSTRPPLLRLVPPPPEDAPTQEPLPGEHDAAPTTTTEGVAADAERAAVTIARALAEVLAGNRNPAFRQCRSQRSRAPLLKIKSVI